MEHKKKNKVAIIFCSLLVCSLISLSSIGIADATICGYSTTGSVTTTTSGGNTILKFTTSGSFTISCGTGGTVTQLIVGGGGGGGATGGGGAGGLVSTSDSLTAQTYTVTVGTGGTGRGNVGGNCNTGNPNPCTGNDGTNSSFNGHVGIGGGGGGGEAISVISPFIFGHVGDNGGSGGGGGGQNGGTNGNYAGGTGSQGKNGGHSGGQTGSGSGGQGGGGGGQGVAGANAQPNQIGNAGNGGNGVANSITGASITYAGGGGGGIDEANGGTGTAGTGGTGGGGAGSIHGNGGAGTNGLGAGGGGASFGTTGATEFTGGNGGDGVVILSFLTPPPIPSPPTLTKANTISSSQIQPIWASSAGATFYLVKRESPTGGGFSQIANVTSLNYNNTGLTAGTQYNYEIFAGNSSGTSAASNTKSNYTSQVAPTGLTFSSFTTTTARVSWTNPSGNFSGFKIERETPVGGGFATIVSNTNNSTNHYDFTGLSAGTQYNVRISTNSGSPNSVSSPSVAASFYTVPAAPTLSKANTISTSQIQPIWASAPSATWYLVKKESPVGGGFSQIANVTSLNYNNTGLTAGTQYNYEIFAGSSSGTSAASNTKSNYTSQVAPTTLVFSNIVNNAARVSWTNPSGNESGFKIEKESPTGGGFSTVISNTNNSTNHYDLSTLNGNTQYNVRISTNYGSPNKISSPSTAASFYTLPNPPTNLQVTRTVSTQIRVTWTAPTDNGTVNGYKIEFSTNSGSSWSTAVANTGNSTLHYDHTSLNSQLGYMYRISTLKYSGTSPPSASSAISFWKQVMFTNFESDGTTFLTGSVLQSNSTSSNNIFPIQANGSALITGVFGLQNYTLKDAVTNLFVLKSYNQNSTKALPTSLNANVIAVDCPLDGAGNDFKLEINETNGHRISSITPVTCNGSDLVKWNATFTANGKSTTSYNSIIKLIVSNSNYQTNAQSLLVNNTATGTSYNSTSNILTSSSYVVGQGTKTYLITYQMQLQCICPPPPPSGGGGGGGGTPLSLIGNGTISGLSVKGFSFQANLGQVENGTITIQWNGGTDLTISSLDAGTYSNWLAFPATPMTFKYMDSNAPTVITFPITLHVPSVGCDAFRGITVNCAENKLYIIPVTINAKLGDTAFSTVANISVNTLNNQSYGLITALGIFGVAISAFIIRGTNLGRRFKHKKRKEGEFLSKLKDW